jgi:ribosome recycling factor
MYDFTHTKNNITEITEWLATEYKSISTGRATPSVLDGVSLFVYGAKTPITHVASVSIEDPRTLRVAPWDKAQIREIEKAISEEDLGLSVSGDDSGVRVFFPQLTTETRSRLVKVLKEKLEEARVRVRSVREATLKDIDAKEKEGGMSEDDKFRLKEELQKMVTEANNTLEHIFEKKEQDTMTI